MRPQLPAALILLILAGFLVSGVFTPTLPLPLALPPPDASPVSQTLAALPDALPGSDPPAATPAPAPPPKLDAGAAVTLRGFDFDVNGAVLLADLDGTVYLVEDHVIKWKLSTGGPLWHFLSNFTSNEYYVYPDEDLKLYEFSKDMGVRKFDLTIDQLVRNTPHVNGSMVTVGSQTSAIFTVNADNGRLLDQNNIPGMWTSAVVPATEEKSLSLTLETENSDYVINIARTDYFVKSLELNKLLWSVHRSILKAWTGQIDIPVIYIKQEANLGGTKFPPASSGQNTAIFEKSLLQYLCESKRSCMPGTVAVTEQNTDETSLSIVSQDETDQFPTMKSDGHISPSTSSLLIYSDSVRPNIGTVVSKSTESKAICLPDFFNVPVSSQNSSEDGAFIKLDPVEMLPKNVRVFAWLILSALFLLPVSYYLILRPQVKFVAELNDMRGHHPVFPKKKKVRKSGNLRSSGIISSDDNLIISERNSSETNGDRHIKDDARYPFLNLLRPEDSSNGRWVGRLFVLNSEIGRGSNGTVVLEGVYDGRPVAVKRLLRAHHDVALKEIQNLIASDQHPNIVRWYGVEQDIDFVYISLERCNCSLSDLIQLLSGSSSHPMFTEDLASDSISNNRPQLEYVDGIDKDLELWSADGFPSTELLRLMRDMVSGLAHLHDLGIIHRDLKPQNVLINNDRFLTAKLSDMGISKRLLEDMSSLSHHVTGYGSSGWQAPEQLLRGRQTCAMDLFSLGCIFFFCITKGKHPFGNYFERDSNILNNRIDLFLVDHIPEAVDLLSQMLDAKPKMRPTALEVLHHPFFWSSEMRLSFLRDTSDRIELEDRENESELLKALENISSAAFGGKWGDKLDAAFITDMGRYRKYNFDCMRDLLRVIRNKLNHYRELPKELQEILGQVPEGFDRYFSSRFPNLLIEVYKVVSGYCKEEDCFRKYFKNCLV